MDDRFNRIFELARAAGLIEWDELPSGALTPDHLSVARAHKFAELIVRECCEVVNDAVDHREPASTYATKIQKYFGVDNG
jgi:hypothetical protein